jgi:antitoxin component of RelBE/YafQ-DinJ toxin-antitoxin module
MANKDNTQVTVNIPQECTESHKLNIITKKAIENARAKKGLKQAATVQDLFKKLSE